MAKHKRLKAIGDYLYDKGEMIEQMFSSIPIVEIRNMVPIKLQGMPLHELKAECLVELLGISDREILNILDGKKERTVSSSDSEQGAYVISDEERKISEKRIKREKKDTVRKIKTERISSKKNDSSRNSEPSTSKKKRKSKELVEVKSKKKKKSDDKPANISNSRDAPKVPVSKKKKDEKKKDSSKKKEEHNVDEIVVLDDDSDKEEKRGQKSLLDLLELEMRARAIRSLLKKEEAVQAQKILSEYKDEPDDLIPVDIEPPHIELLSDSGGEEITDTIDLETHKNMSTQKMNEDISSKHPEGSFQSSKDQVKYSSPPSSCAIEKIATSDSTSEILNENSSKSTNQIEGQAAKSDLSDPSPVAMKDCEKNKGASTISASSDHYHEIQSNVFGDVISVEAGELPGLSGPAFRCSSASKQDNISCGPTGESVGRACTEQDTSDTDMSQKPEKSQCISSSAKNSGNETDTCHFLVSEGPSIVQVTDGSQITESIVDANSSSIEIIKPSSNLDSGSDQNTCSIENIDGLTVEEEFQQPTIAECFQVDSNSDVANEKGAVDNSDPDFIEYSHGKVANCDFHEEDSGRSNTGANLTLHTPTERRESTDRCLVEDDLHSQFEDEVLDYDYNPVNSYCEKESDASIPPSEDPPSCLADKTLGHGSSDYHSSHASYQNCNDNEKIEDTIINMRLIGKLNNLEDSAYQVSNDSEIVEPGGVNLVHPLDHPLEETASNTYSLSENLGDCMLGNDSNKRLPLEVDFRSRNQLETIKLKEEGSSSDLSSPELSKASEPKAIVLMSMIETKYNSSTQESNSTNEANGGLSKIEANPEDSLENIYTHEIEEHSCLNIKPPVDVAVEQVVSPVHSQMHTEKCLTLQLPGSNSGSSENIATINTVTDDLLVSDKNISNVGKIVTPQNSSVHVPGSGYTADLVQQTCIINSELDEKTTISEPGLLFSSNCNFIPDKSSNAISSPISEPLVLFNDPEILNVANESRVPHTSGTNANSLGCDETQPSSFQDLINADVPEIIDITEQEPVDSSEVVFVSEERVDSDSIDESDNEISEKAALMIVQMNNILNDDVCIVGECSSGDSGQPSPQATCVVPAKVYAVISNSGSSESTDEENEDVGLSDDNTVLEVSDLDEPSEEETKDEETCDTNGSESSLDRGSIEVIDDSDSVCSVESQRGDSKSDDCVMVLQPQDSTDDCIIVMEPDISQNSNSVVLTEPEGSESDDCAIISQHSNDPNLDEQVHIYDKEVPCVKATGSMSSENPDKDSVMVTIIIEDDEGGEEEEVQLLTEGVPAEILELDDNDEAKTNWTARWLESDNVKKVVQTSKILTNVRKQMKMKLKKIEAAVTNDLKLPEEKSAPPLIGSVEEYHRLVKEGVIFSKATRNDEKTESSNNLINESVVPSKESTNTVSAEIKAQEGHEKKSDKTEETGKKTKSDKYERKKKLENPKSKRKSDKDKKKKSDKFSSYHNNVPKIAPSPGAKEADTYLKSNEKVEALDIGKVVVEDEVREDGEIIEPSNNEVPECIGNPKARNKTHGKIMDDVFDDRDCRVEQNRGKDRDREEREEGETSEKEEGEISDSDCDGRESRNSSQLEPNLALKTTGGLKECSRSASPLSSIPLPPKLPTKQLTTQQHTNHPKRQLTKISPKTPDRNSAAKRFILRNLQLGRKRPANSKNKKKKKKGAGRGNKKGFGYSPNATFEKNKCPSNSQRKSTYEKPIRQTEVSMLASTSNSLQTVPGIQPSYLATYSGLSQPRSSMSQLGSAQNTPANVSSTAQTYDSYYSWAYSQGLISSASGNYGYGTSESTPDPNVYKQWEEYYRKLMEACKVSAEHASAGSLLNVSSASTTEKSGYTWVFDHSNGASKTAQVVQQTSADFTTEPVAQVEAPVISSETREVNQSVEMSDKDRFESWQYRFGLKGLLKEHFITAPTAPSTGDGSQKS